MFDIMEFLNRIFKKNGNNGGSGEEAKERLKLVLISDRATVAPHVMESLKEELIQVISRYMTIDTSMMEMGLERKGKEVALAANIPVIGMKRNNRKESMEGAPPIASKPEPAKPAAKQETVKPVPKAEKPAKPPVVKPVVEEIEEEEEKPAFKQTVPVKNEPAPPAMEQDSDEDEGDDDASRSRKGKKGGRRYLARTSTSNSGRRTSSSRRRS